MHRWYVPVAAQQVRGPAREPVVAMHDVVANTLSQREQRDLVGKIRQIAEDSVFGDGAGWSGVDRNNARAARQLDYLWSQLVCAAGEDIDSDAQLIELARQLADVDVEPTRVRAAQHCQWRGVHAQHRD